MKIDMHVHTSRSGRCGWMKPKRLVEQAIKRGLDGLAITDHNTICGALEASDMVKDEQMSISIIVGEEISTDRGEVLAYFIGEEIGPGLFEDVLSEVRREGGISAIPHPFDRLRRHAVHLTCDDVGLFDAIEAFNARCLSNDLAFAYAKRHNITMIAGSDAHFPNEVGNGGIVTSKMDIRRAFDERDITIYGRRSMVVNHVGTKILKLMRGHFIE